MVAIRQISTATAFAFSTIRFVCLFVGIRKLVGGGNPSRLKQVWDEHVASQSVVEAVPVAELPIEVAQQLEHETAALVQRLGSMAVDLNDRAVKASERRVGEVIRTAGEQREQAEAPTGHTFG